MNNKYIIQTVVKPKIANAISSLEEVRFILLGNKDNIISPEDISLLEKFESLYKSLFDLNDTIEDRASRSLY